MKPLHGGKNLGTRRSVGRRTVSRFRRTIPLMNLRLIIKAMSMETKKLSLSNLHGLVSLQGC